MSFAEAGAVFPRPAAGSWHELVRLVSDALTCRQESGSRPVSDSSGRRLTIAASVESSVRSSVDLAPADVTVHLETPTLDDENYGDPIGAGDDGPEPDFDDSIGSDHSEVWGYVRRAQAGDGAAFGLLYDRYVDQVYRFIYYRVNDRALAEDFTSETFLRALRRISTINYQGRDIGAWFMTIARNIVFDHSKSARFRLEMSTGETIEGDERAPSPELTVLANLTNARLLQAVNDLNDEQKECVALRFLQGLSVAETAEVMGKNEGAIKALQHRAVKRLAVLIGDDLR